MSPGPAAAATTGLGWRGLTWLLAPPLAVLLLRALLQALAEADADGLQALHPATLVSDPAQALWAAARPAVFTGLGLLGAVLGLRLAGRAALRELCLLGTPIDAARALQLGLVNRVVPAADLESETMKLAAQLASAAPLALRGVLDAVVLGGECGIEEGLQFETAQFALLFASEDMREGTDAFLAKRKPQFQNR